MSIVYRFTYIHDSAFSFSNGSAHISVNANVAITTGILSFKLDKFVAENLHKILETYELPKNLKEQLNVKVVTNEENIYTFNAHKYKTS